MRILCEINHVHDVLEMIYHNLYKSLILDSSLNPKTFVKALEINYHNHCKRLILDSILNHKIFIQFYEG